MLQNQSDEYSDEERIMQVDGPLDSSSEKCKVQLKKKRKTEKVNGEEFFRATEELDFEYKKKTNSHSYLGNLRSEKAFEVLKEDFLSVRDADSMGNLKKDAKENTVFVKLVKCENEDGERQHFPICLKCNSKEKTTAMIKSIDTKVKVKESFKRENLKDCIHAQVGEILFTKEESKKVDDSTSNTVEIISNDKQHVAICFDGETHGLIFVNLARKANKGKCLKCKSINCRHTKVWDQEKKKEILGKKQEDIEMYEDFDESKENIEQDKRKQEEKDVSEDVEENIEEDKEVKENSLHKLNYPFDRATQEKMKKADSMMYDKLTNLVPKPCEGEVCPHGNLWNQEDPIENAWIYSSKIKIAHSKFIEDKERKVFYTPLLRTVKFFICLREALKKTLKL